MHSRAQFASGGPSVGRRLGRWVRRYPAPLVLTGVFVLALGGSLAASGGRQESTAITITPEVHAPGTTRPLCPVCGIGERCDSSTGTCVLDVATTPQPCVKGSKYDDKLGFCVPVATPKPTPYPSKTLDPRAAGQLTPAPPATPLPPGTTATPTERPERTPAQSTPRAASPTPEPANE